MRTMIALLLLAFAAHAGESDGGTAPARRWSHARGPASRSCMSAAKAPESLGALAWTYDANPPIDAVPLAWDGLVYLRQGDKVVCLDAESGRQVASAAMPGAGAAALDGGAFYVRMGARIVQWRRREASLTRRWSAEVGNDASAPCLYEGELYVTAGGKVVRLRPGQKDPAWSSGEGAYGEPALYGEEVYALEGSAVVARARLDGREVARLDLGRSAKLGLVAVNRMHVCARVGDQWVIARRVHADGKLTFTRPWPVPYAGEPLVYARSTIGLARKEGKPAFTLFRWIERQKREGKGKDAKVTKFVGKEDRDLVRPGTRTDLLDGAGWPISLDDWFCTGLWCANLNANRIAWHLHERADRPLLKDGVGLRPVPVDDERLLVVSKDGKELLCLQSEVIGG